MSKEFTDVIFYKVDVDENDVRSTIVSIVHSSYTKKDVCVWWGRLPTDFGCSMCKLANTHPLLNKAIVSELFSQGLYFRRQPSPRGLVPCQPSSSTRMGKRFAIVLL